MRKWVLCMILCGICLLMPAAVSAGDMPGGTDQQGSVRTGLHKIDGAYYYFDTQGIPYRDCFITVNNKKYYFGPSGKRADYTGWKTIKGMKYYFHKKHYVVTKPGWQTIDGKKYYFSTKGVMYSEKWATVKGKRYYFKKSGQMATRWAKYKGKYYYFKKDGELERKTIGKFKNDYYLINEKGVRGANILQGVGIKKGMSKAKKLRVCFNYVIKNFDYLPAELWPPKGWEPYHAYRIMVTRHGNCYDYAAAFCYMARAVGYKGMICVAGERSDETGGYRPHGWCELNGKVYDPRLTYPNGRHPYNVSYGDLPYRYRK